MLAALTGLGLSTAAGLNAYIPLLVVGVLAHLTDAVRLPQEYAWMAEGWALAVISALLLVELVFDKVPVIDHVNDVIQTAVRPAAGGMVFTATQAAAELDESAWMTERPWVGWALGIVAALAVHALKVTARPLINAATVGPGAPLISTAEDAGSLDISLIAVFLPILIILTLLFLAVLAWWVIRRIRRRRAARRARAAEAAGPDHTGR